MFLDYQTTGENCIDMRFDPCTGNAPGDPVKDAAFWSVFVDAENPSSCEQFRDGYWADPTQGVAKGSIETGSTNDAIASSEDALRRALDWMIRDGIALQINITSRYESRTIFHDVEIVGPNICRFSLSAIRNQNQWVWNGYS